MYAVCEIKGKQFTVEEGMQLRVPLLKEEIGETVEFDKVFFIGDEKNIVGTPIVKNAKITAEVLSHKKDKKIIVFKKKRRKGYRVKNGHRQGYTRVRITGIDS